MRHLVAIRESPQTRINTRKNEEPAILAGSVFSRGNKSRTRLKIPTARINKGFQNQSGTNLVVTF